MRDPRMFHYTNQGGEPKVYASNFILFFAIFCMSYSETYDGMLSLFNDLYTAARIIVKNYFFICIN